MKDLPPAKDPIEAMGEAYELLLEDALKETHKIEEKTGPALHHAIDAAGIRAAKLAQLTREEAEKLAGYLKRDLIDAARYIKESGKDFRAWFGFDAGLIRDRLRELFTQAADQTTVELRELKEQASGYHTGEITGPGTLCCNECGELLHFHRPGRIPPCPKCHGTVFRRATSGEDIRH
ncbi:MAG TPA: hypothetical protein ENI99_04230 [Sedimenticola sp.]|nr:hypothetical protein [Sedimenticola sp.]